jgi:hypothetical protein
VASKKNKRKFENNRHLGKFSLDFFFVILGLCTTGLLFENLKKIEFEMGDTFEKSRKIHHFGFLKKKSTKVWQ